MEDLNDVRLLVRRGHFSAALAALEELPSARRHSTDAEIMRMELFERTGLYERAQTLAQRLSSLRTLGPSHRSACEFTLGLLAWDAGKSVDAIEHLQRAISLGDAAKDLLRSCWAQLRLVVLLAGRSGPGAAFQLLADARSNVIKLGDPLVSAALHVFVGEMEAKRGLVHSAACQTNLGQRLLSSAPNAWLEAVAENNHAAIAIMMSDLHGGIAHAKRARELSDESGAAAMLRASHGNLGNLYYMIGDFGKATEYLDQAASLLPSTGEYSNSAFDALARTHLAQGHIDETVEYLNRIERTISSPADETLYSNRYSQLTTTELLIKRCQWREALTKVHHVEALCDKAKDQLLCTIARIRRVEILGRMGELRQAAAFLCEVSPVSEGNPPDLLAHYERTLGVLVGVDGDTPHAELHFKRAERFFSGIGSAPGLLEVAECRANVGRCESIGQSGLSTGSNDVRLGASLLQDVAALMMHAGRPELLATGLVAILADTGSVNSAIAVARNEGDPSETLASYGTPQAGAATRLFALGKARHRDIEVVVEPKTDLESFATLNAVSMLLGAVHDLELAHVERDERLALWPADELPTDDDDAVILGEMRKVMALARKVARANVGVLITGESGTGKEVLARAVHKYSGRANKPFVPFNCTAIPRELLESQLFGHRRGAFTGADHSLGLIRSAQNGTLFLDEIGELGLDLQPKLLRFLESGEINPLGEPTPVNVDVRIIAATNANLEQLVQDGRFREDLYYRLNVIRLTIPPLRERRDEIPMLVHHFVARAASEFSKGRIRVAEETMEHVLLYAWPGNIRQLQNELRRMVALADADAVLMPAALSGPILRATPKATRTTNGLEIAVPLTDKLLPTLSRIEGEMIRVALRAHHGKVDAAARALGISRKGLYLKRQRLGL